MPTQTLERPGLHPAVKSLIAVCIPALRDGGRLPLARVVEAAAGGVLKASVIQALEGRGEIVFERRGADTFFSNSGPQLKIPLRRFDLVIPPRISGQAVEVPDGVAFHFDAKETLRAMKFLLSVNLERLDVTSERIFVRVQGGLFDQCIDLV